MRSWSGERENRVESYEGVVSLSRRLKTLGEANENDFIEITSVSGRRLKTVGEAHESGFIKITSVSGEKNP